MAEPSGGFVQDVADGKLDPVPPIHHVDDRQALAVRRPRWFHPVLGFLVSNHLRSIEKDLATKRQEIEKETTWQAKTTRETNPGAKPLVYESDRGKLVEQITRTYSFNDSGILAAVMEGTDSELGGAIRILRESNALKLEWKISFLENVADRFGFDVPRTRREIEDGDPDFLVGVVSTSKMVRG